VPSAARERLVNLLAAQDEMSSSVQLRAKAPADLDLEVEGIGHITLPVAADQARRLRDLGRPAHFGRGEETLTDPTVRDTWQIPTELVRVEWAGGQGLGPELETVREELGLPEHSWLTAELHSLLVYEKGQFFRPHQDSEKDDAMVATLVVTLPSAHTGGELVVHHLGETTTYRGSKTRVSLVAFYADCRHEVRPVTSGHRITLTYNLFLHGDPAGRVPDEATVGELSGYLGEHFTTEVRHRYRDTPSAPPHRLAFLLDHEYTERSLSWALLKGTDVHRASLLRAAADVAGCETVLALAEINEMWDAYEPESDDYRRSSREYRYWDGQEDAEDADADYQLNELIDSSIRLTRWTDPEGTSAEEISLVVADAEVCAVTPSSDLQPYTSEYEGYMGNYGNTLDRWYRRAAVVVWPRNRSFTNRAEASPSWAMDDLSAQARDGDPAAARAAAATLAPFWDAAARRQEQPGQLLAKALPAAAALDDADAASILLRPFAIENLSRRHMASLAELTGCYGEEWTDELLRVWFGSRPAYPFGHGPSRPQWFTMLPALCDALPANGSPDGSTALRLLELAWASLATLISSAVASRSPADQRQQLDSLGEPLAALIAGAETTQSADLQNRIVAFCRQHGDAVTSCVIRALRAAAAVRTQTRPGDVFGELATDRATWLRARLAQPTRAADDWSIELLSGCTCELSGILRSFLADQARRTLEWPLAKDRRSHVHSRIDQAELPVSHLTRRQGRPFTLVLTKTVQLFEREAEQRTRDQTDLNWLLGVYDCVSSSTSP
jgi:predicted 2-oxoglutarate/Fe(II)-dependent dioxygenase YbiX